jgi:hypothetical protein
VSAWPAVLTAFFVVLGGLCLWTAIAVPIGILVGRALARGNSHANHQETS